MNRYPTLKILSAIHALAGYFVIFAGFIVGFLSLVQTNSLIGFIFSLIGGMVLGSSLLVISEGIRLFVNIEEHLFVMRRKAEPSNFSPRKPKATTTSRPPVSNQPVEDDFPW